MKKSPLACFMIICVLCLNVNPGRSQTLRLEIAWKTPAGWTFWINNLAIDQLTSSSSDMVVIDFSRDGSSESSRT